MKITIEDVKDVVEEADVLIGDVNDIKNDISLGDQGIDSLDIVNIYLLLEEKYDIKIPDEDLDKVKTIDSIVLYINKKLLN
jgi:acyl carrier protein